VTRDLVRKLRKLAHAQSTRPTIRVNDRRPQFNFDAIMASAP
jgi:hypothetical protein